MVTQLLTLLLLLSTILSDVANAGIIEGSVPPDGTNAFPAPKNDKAPLQFISKFCFDTTGPGTLNLTISDAKGIPTIGDPNKGPQFVFYYDVDGSWAQVYHTSKTCQEKLKLAKQRVPVTTAALNAQFDDTKRPHFWYVAVLDCDKDRGDYRFKFKATFQQSAKAADLDREFSYDEQGSPQMFMAFFMIFLLLCLMNLFSTFKLAKRKSLHPIMRLISLSLILTTAGLFLTTLHYYSYAGNGVGLPAARTIGQVCDMIGTVSFIVVLLLIARGWGITYPSLKHLQDQRVKLAVVVGAFFVCYIVLFFVQEFALDPAATDFVYASIPGWILNAVRTVTLCYFLWALWGTYNDDPDRSKKIFYVVFGSSYSAWFISLPVLTLVSLAIPIWYKLKIVQSIYMTIEFMSYALIVGLLWPTVAVKYFEVAVPDLLSTRTGAGYDVL